MAEKKIGLQTKKERKEIALKRFMKCASCNQPMRGYIAKGYDMPYYKCNTPGCKCNRNANKVNDKFAKMLGGYRVDKTYLPLIKEQLFLTFQDHNAGLKESEEMISRQLTDIRHKLERLEERFILEELTGELYNKYKAKFEKETEELEAQRASNKIEMSKLEDFISVSLDFACNLREMWDYGNYNQRQELQNALFEAGIVYDRQKDECRGTGDNEFITEIAQLSGNFSNFNLNKKKKLILTSVGAFRAKSRNFREARNITKPVDPEQAQDDPVKLMNYDKRAKNKVL